MNIPSCICIIAIIATILSCNPPENKKLAKPLKFRGSWFLRVHEIDFNDSLNPGKMVVVKGNEEFEKFPESVFNQIKKGSIRAINDTGRALSYKQICLSMLSQNLLAVTDTNNIDEADLFNPKLMGVELNDSIFLDVVSGTKTYKVHSINLFIPSEYSETGNNKNICRVMFKELRNKGLDSAISSLENRKFARKEKLYKPDGTTSEEYTFYLTDAAGVEYFFRTPIEEVLADRQMMDNSILRYFVDDLTD
ncbi:MAG: hypothetical protein NW207_07265 [Cytophagales bacterium]|nr:hypothetical protein [Cytophagales bacterium]